MSTLTDAEKFTRLEYIEGIPGQQLIDTGIKVNHNNIRVKCEWMLRNTGNSHVNYVPLFGNYKSESDPSLRIILANTDSRYYVNINWTSSGAKTLPNLSIGVKHNLDMRISGGKYYVDVDADNYTGNFTFSDTNDKQLFIYSASGGESVATYSAYCLRIYSFAILSGDTLLANYIPCKIGNKIGLFDTVTKTLKENAGIDAFTAGPEYGTVTMNNVRRRVIQDAPHLVTPASAQLHTFNTDMIAPLKSCRINFSPIQAGSGDPDPINNIRQITGWTGITLYARNKNLFNDDYYTLGNAMSLITDPEDTFYGFYGGSVSSWAEAAWNKIGGLLGDGRVDFGRIKMFATVGATNTFSYRFWFWHKDEASYGYDGNISAPVNSSGVAAKYSDSGKICKGAVISTSAGRTNYRGRIKNVMITNDVNHPTTEYIAPQSHDYDVDWTTEAGTVPGGYIDLLTGELVVDRVGKYLSTLTWTENASAHAFNGAGFTERKRQINGTDGVALCDTYTFYLSTTVAEADYGIALANTKESNANRSLIYVKDIRYDTAQEFTAALAQNDVFVVCPLLTPITYQLDPVTIKTLRGLNNIWSTANGNIELSYWTH